jgi:periplasmic divalent cation tolerance protein
LNHCFASECERRLTISDTIQVITTIDSEEAARELADLLVTGHLAACVQIVGPISSTYWWEGRVEQAQEWLCLVKTRAERFADIDRTIREHHSYDVPEIVALPAVDVGESYLRWILDTVPPSAT